MTLTSLMMSFTVQYEFKPLAEICHRQARW